MGLRTPLVIALVVAASAGVALAAGIGPALDPAATTPTPTGEPSTPTPEGPAAGTTSTVTVTASGGASLAFAVERIETCGETCRDVTTLLTNTGDAAATDVAVRTRIYAGNGTDEGDLVRTGSRAVGRIDAGESVTATERVRLSLSDAVAVQGADGWITVETTIETDGGTTTTVERRDVI